MTDTPLNTTQVQRDKWRKQRNAGMVSAIGEYTPDEFWDALDDIDQLERELAEARELCALTEQRLIDATLRPAEAATVVVPMEQTEAIFFDLGGDYELCRFPSSGEWTLRVKQNDVTHVRYLDELETRIANAMLAAAQGEGKP